MAALDEIVDPAAFALDSELIGVVASCCANSGGSATSGGPAPCFLLLNKVDQVTPLLDSAELAALYPQLESAGVDGVLQLARELLLGSRAAAVTEVPVSALDEPQLEQAFADIAASFG